MRKRTYMVVEHFRGGDAAPVYQRFRERGRLAPEGLSYVASWVDSALRCCYQVMETADPALLEQWMAQWRDLVDFEVHEVIPSAEAAERVLPAGPRSFRLRGRSGRDTMALFRPASLDDVPRIERLVALSARGLSRDEYSDEQIEAALGSALGVDSQLVRDGSYFVAEVDGELVACGGWSWRKTLFGGDARSGREPEALDPARDAARIRAFFVHPDWARRGLGRAMLELCESEARTRGFRSADLMATLPGVHLYRSCGYRAQAPIQHGLPGGLEIEFVPMGKDLGPFPTGPSEFPS